MESPNALLQSSSGCTLVHVGQRERSRESYLEVTARGIGFSLEADLEVTVQISTFRERSAVLKGELRVAEMLARLYSR